jgi:hypothetical protein
VRKLVAALAAVSCIAAETGSGIAPLGKYTAMERRHWSFQSRKPVTPPPVPGASSPIDAFLLARLTKEGLGFAPAASRETLIRRVTFDLTGLPPSPAEVAAFLADRSPDAYEKLVDRLLDSPRYGEQWGRHWLDVVRFAETDGFEYDTHRADAWRYRDYVIHALNTDKPYPVFVTEQLAGDEIAPQNETYRIASGFNRLGPLRKNAGNQEVASSRNEVLTEMTNMVGAGLLGVTLGCARCHDHKFDPIRQSDYYRIQAYFSATHDEDVPLSSPQEQAEWKAKTETIQRELKALQKQMRGLEGEAKSQMEKRIRSMEAELPPPLPALFSVSDNMEKRTPIHLLARGDHLNKGDAVGPRPLGVLLPDGAPEQELKDKPRAALAAWVTSPDNPLTARVMVNRIWSHHFGRGIVGTPNDFGRMGLRPTHPELLDWLANEFVASGWRSKPIHRMILLSQAYRQSSSSPVAKAAEEKDPENKLLWKFNRRRLEAEEIRDAMLMVAGKLNTKAGGPSVIVPVEQELINLLYKPSQWAVTPDAAEHDRRSVYLLQKRNLRLPFSEVFDGPDLQISCPRREQSTHAPQALEMLNGDLSNRMAGAFADRLLKEQSTNAARISAAFRLAAGRAPNAAELAAARKFLLQPAATPEHRQRQMREFALALFNTNAFLYVN